jgi:hypothetical protein
MDKIICFLCNKNITKKNLARHKKSRVHKLNEIIKKNEGLKI